MKKKIPMVFAVVFLIISGFLFSGCLNEYDELELNEFKFVEGEDNEDEIEDGYEYDPGEEVFMYFEVEGFKADDGVVDWAVFVTVTNSTGEAYSRLDEEELENKTEEIDADWGTVEFGPKRMNIYPGIAIEWDQGKHEVKFEVVDNVGNKNLTFTENFVVEE